MQICSNPISPRLLAFGGRPRTHICLRCSWTWRLNHSLQESLSMHLPNIKLAPVLCAKKELLACGTKCETQFAQWLGATVPGSTAALSCSAAMSRRAVAAASCSAESTPVESISVGSPEALELRMPRGFGESCAQGHCKVLSATPGVHPGSKPSRLSVARSLSLWLCQ